VVQKAEIGGVISDNLLIRKEFKVLLITVAFVRNFLHSSLVVLCVCVFFKSRDFAPYLDQLLVSCLKKLTAVSSERLFVVCSYPRYSPPCVLLTRPNKRSMPPAGRVVGLRYMQPLSMANSTLSGHLLTGRQISRSR